MPPPQFFDIFGLISFVFLIILSLLLLLGKKVPYFMFVILFLIGFLGLIIDGLMVYQFYLK